MVNPNYLQHLFGTMTQYIVAHPIKLSVIGVTGKGVGERIELFAVFLEGIT